MRSAIRFTAACLLTLGFVGAASAKAPKIGETVENVTLLNALDNKQVSLTEFEKAKAVAVIFVATQCPVSNAYNERMARLWEAYKEKGIQFVGINSNEKELIPEIKEHAAKNKLTFPILKDPANKIADRWEAKVTPEVFLLELKKDGDKKSLTLLYHGMIDDTQNGKEIKNPYLVQALDAFIAGKPIAKTETKAFGCTIKRVAKGDAGATP